MLYSISDNGANLTDAGFDSIAVYSQTAAETARSAILWTIRRIRNRIIERRNSDTLKRGDS